MTKIYKAKWRKIMKNNLQALIIYNRKNILVDKKKTARYTQRYAKSLRKKKPS